MSIGYKFSFCIDRIKCSTPCTQIHIQFGFLFNVCMIVLVSCTVRYAKNEFCEMKRRNIFFIHMVYSNSIFSKFKSFFSGITIHGQSGDQGEPGPSGARGPPGTPGSCVIFNLFNSKGKTNGVNSINWIPIMETEWRKFYLK